MRAWRTVRCSLPRSRAPPIPSRKLGKRAHAGEGERVRVRRGLFEPPQPRTAATARVAHAIGNLLQHEDHRPAMPPAPAVLAVACERPIEYLRGGPQVVAEEGTADLDLYPAAVLVA